MNMPKNEIENVEVYSYRQDKNNFKDILDNMANKLLKAYKDKLLEFKRAKAALKRYE